MLQVKHWFHIKCSMKLRTPLVKAFLIKAMCMADLLRNSERFYDVLRHAIGIAVPEVLKPVCLEVSVR